MGAIFPMAPLKARLGFVRKREKEAKHAAELQRKAASITRGELPLLVRPAAPAAKGRER